MKKLRKYIIIGILFLLIITFMQNHVQAIQYGGDIRMQKIWLTENQEKEARKIENNKKIYEKSENMLEKIIIAGIVISSIISTCLVLKKNIKLKKYYIFLAILAIMYFVIDRYLISTYLKNTYTITGLVYVKVLLIAVGVFIGIFAQGKIQKVLMSSTPAFVVLILGMMGKNMDGVINTAMIIELLVQIILLPQYLIKNEELEEDDEEKNEE